MAELLYPTKYRAKGPWLLPFPQLLSLDQSIDDYFLKYREITAAAAGGTASSTSNPADLPLRTITFRLRHDKELEVASFKEAASHPAAQNENALSFKYEVKSGNVVALLVVEKYKREHLIKQTSWLLFETEDKEAELQISVEPKSASLSQGILAVLRDWAIDVQPPFWQRWILNIRTLGRFILGSWILVLATLFFSPTPPNFKEHYKQEARKILDQGINASNQQKAIELVLAIESDYVPASAKPAPPLRSPRSLVTNVLGLFAVSVVAFFPEFCLGLWKGKRYLRWWQAWMRFVSVTVPGLLVARYFWPQLFNFLEQALGR